MSMITLIVYCFTEVINKRLSVFVIKIQKFYNQKINEHSELFLIFYRLINPKSCYLFQALLNNKLLINALCFQVSKEILNKK